MSEATKEPLMDRNSHSEKLIAARLAEKKNFIEQAEADLAPISHRGKLPETHFKTVFVPFLAGEIQSTPENNLVNSWVAIAGSPASEIDIIDEEGKVLFTAPPLYDTSLINSSAPSDRTLGSIMQEYSNLKQDIPDAAESFLQQHLEKKFNTMMVKPDQTNKNSERWSEILKRYGYGPGQNEGKNTDQDSSKEELNYDEIL